MALSEALGDHTFPDHLAAMTTVVVLGAARSRSRSRSGRAASRTPQGRTAAGTVAQKNTRLLFMGHRRKV